jgi:hypothetical protein
MGPYFPSGTCPCFPVEKIVSGAFGVLRALPLFLELYIVDPLYTQKGICSSKADIQNKRSI